MTPPPTIIEFIRALSNARIEFHGTGTLNQNGEKHGSFFKIKNITPEQTKALDQFGPWVKIASMNDQPVIVLIDDDKNK